MALEARPETVSGGNAAAAAYQPGHLVLHLDALPLYVLAASGTLHTSHRLLLSD